MHNALYVLLGANVENIEDLLARTGCGNLLLFIVQFVGPLIKSLSRTCIRFTLQWEGMKPKVSQLPEIL